MFFHKPVLLREAITYLAPQDGAARARVYIDATLGGGGHTESLLKTLAIHQTVVGSLTIGIDQDRAALDAATVRLAAYGKAFRAIEGNFGDLKELFLTLELPVEKIGGILFDLGISSPQIDEAQRGFSFQKSGPLDMRMSTSATLSAAGIVNEYSDEELAEIFYKYGEEKKSRQIAREIVKRRETKRFETTDELAAAVKRFFPDYQRAEQTKALARIFQALRIAVNRELDVLEKALADAHDLLESGGRLVVISYHSLEDRIVKDFFREKATEDWGPKGVVLKSPLKSATLKILTKKPVEASEEEVSENPRARSAKLRAAEKL